MQKDNKHKHDEQQLDACSQTQLLNKNAIPLYPNPKLVGILCSLLSGHTKLQVHLYKLKLTFSPTCICLKDDETPHHYIFDCPDFINTRNICQPILGNWHSLLSYIEMTKRFTS